MDVKEAARIAKEHVRELFEEERAQNIGLEEIEFDESTSIWLVTVGMSRPWDRDELPASALIVDMLSTPRKLRRDMKVVAIEDATGKILSVKNRE